MRGGSHITQKFFDGVFQRASNNSCFEPKQRAGPPFDLAAIPEPVAFIFVTINQRTPLNHMPPRSILTFKPCCRAMAMVEFGKLEQPAFLKRYGDGKARYFLVFIPKPKLHATQKPMLGWLGPMIGFG
jgi:hypothetical protein